MVFASSAAIGAMSRWRSVEFSSSWRFGPQQIVSRWCLVPGGGVADACLRAARCRGDEGRRVAATAVGYGLPMGDTRLPFDQAFDDAFAHLSECRVAYEEDPRDPKRIAALGAARVALDEARVHMRAERRRLGLEPREVKLPPMPKVDSDGLDDWQGIYQD